jgi:hypothetical protein
MEDLINQFDANHESCNEDTETDTSDAHSDDLTNDPFTEEVQVG